MYNSEASICQETDRRTRRHMSCGDGSMQIYYVMTIEIQTSLWSLIGLCRMIPNTMSVAGIKEKN
jgi:hypothetical protein